MKEKIFFKKEYRKFIIFGLVILSAAVLGLITEAARWKLRFQYEGMRQALLNKYVPGDKLLMIEPVSLRLNIFRYTAVLVTVIIFFLIIFFLSYLYRALILRFKAEQKLKSLGLKDEAILRAVPDIIMQVDNNKVYRWANAAGYEFFGNDVIGKEASFYFAGEQHTYQLVQPLFNGSKDVVYLESWQRRKDGQKRLLAWWCRTLKDIDGNVIGALSCARDITEYKEYEEKITGLAKFPEENPNPIMRVRKNGVILYLNPAAEKLTCLDGRKAGEMITGRLKLFIEEVAKTGTGKDDIELGCADRVFLWRIVPIKDMDYINLYGVDITEKITLDAVLRDREEQLRVVFDTVSEGITFSDEQGRFFVYNNGMERLTGYDMEEANKFPNFISMLYSDAEERKKAFADLAQIAKEGGILSGERKLCCKNNQDKYVIVQSALVSFKDKKMFLSVYMDITERKIMENELKNERNNLDAMLKEKIKELDESYKSLENAKRLSDIGSLAATVAHELRNPLGVIKTAVYNIRRKSSEDCLKSHLVNIEKKISESDQIIRNLLVYSRLKAPEFESVMIAGLLREVVENMENKYPQYNIDIDLKNNCAKERACVIEADSLQLGELFSNLIDNSYQAFSEKKGKIEIFLDYNEAVNKCNLIFKDNGSGIPQGDLPKIFEPFFTKKAHGIGLGLTVCREIINMHSGDIVVTSKAGEGTSIFIGLPIKRGGA